MPRPKGSKNRKMKKTEQEKTVESKIRPKISLKLL